MTTEGPVPWLSAESLLAGGPSGQVKQLERMLWHLGFEDVRVIDGAGDMGGDILAVRGGEEWVIQSKWTSSGSIDASGVNEVNEAFTAYKADQAVLATNAHLSGVASRRVDELANIGLRLITWDGATLSEISERMLDRVPERHRPRKYQEEAIARLETDLAQHGRALLILATGLGKTVVGGHVISRYLEAHPSAQILVVSHLKELSAQLERAMWHHLRRETATHLLTGDDKPENFDGVVAATIESAVTAVYEGYRPDLVMIDEAHHVGETGRYRELLELLEGVPFFGVTATPWRGDEFDLSDLFGPPSFRMGIAEGMAKGWLSDVDYRLFVDNMNWEYVREQSANGYSIRELNRRLFLPQRDAEIIEHIHQAWVNTASPRAIVFCQTIPHAEEVAELLRRSSPSWRDAAALHSQVAKQQRNILLNQFKLGRTPILTCVDVLNEGVDVPDVNLIAFLRVTHSRRIFVQQLGRGLRISEGKDKLKVLDFVTDIRRVAEALQMRRELEGEIEKLKLSTSLADGIAFSDETSGSLLDLWLKDAADVASASDEVRLQFPEY